jgi:hypothetical protein
VILQKGLEFDVHVYANDKTTAIQEAFDLYKDAQTKAKECEIPLAPIEVK